MKKTLLAILALIAVTTITLTACGKDDPKDDENDDLWEDYYNDQSQSTTDSSSGTGDVTEGTGTESQPVIDLGGWVNKNDTVYILHPTYLRNSATGSATTNITLSMGASVTRTATNGTWDKVTYNEKTYYVWSYLTTDNRGEVTFKDIEPTATSIINTDTTGTKPSQTNLRTTPCYDEDLENLGASALTKAMTTAEGVTFQVTGINESGTWARVYFKGTDARGQAIEGTFYVRPNYLEYFQTQNPDDTGSVKPV